MKQRKSEINWKLVVRVACLMLLDVMLLYLACLLALLSRFDLSIHTLMRDSGFPVDGDRHDCPVHPTEALQ